jgi:hypothetical protein
MVTGRRRWRRRRRIKSGKRRTENHMCGLSLFSAKSKRKTTLEKIGPYRLATAAGRRARGRRALVLRPTAERAACRGHVARSVPFVYYWRRAGSAGVELKVAKEERKTTCVDLVYFLQSQNGKPLWKRSGRTVLLRPTGRRVGAT